MLAPINSSQVLILQTLAKHPDGLTTAEVAKKSGMTPNAGNIGPVFDEVLKNYPESLHARKLVKVEKHEDGIRWRITKAGEKIAPTVKARKRADSLRVPPEVLNPAYLTFAKTRTYGIESYSTADLVELRGTLGEDYAEMNLEDLREQVTNQRKRGAYSDPKAKIRLAVERTIRDFGPDGAVHATLSAKQVEELRALIS